MASHHHRLCTPSWTTLAWRARSAACSHRLSDSATMTNRHNVAGRRAPSTTRKRRPDSDRQIGKTRQWLDVSVNARTAAAAQRWVCARSSPRMATSTPCRSTTRRHICRQGPSKEQMTHGKAQPIVSYRAGCQCMRLTGLTTVNQSAPRPARISGIRRSARCPLLSWSAWMPVDAGRCDHGLSRKASGAQPFFRFVSVA